MAESTQHKLDRIRPPRVQITYDVEIGDAIQMKELPFVGGIMADLSGKPEEPLPKMKDRKFVEIDRFGQVVVGPALHGVDRLTQLGEGGNQQYGQILKRIDKSIENFQGRRIDPVNIFYDNHQRTFGAETYQLINQHRDGLNLLLCWG